MRVTNQTIIRSSVNHLQSNLQAVEKSRRDVSTGRRLHAMSDDPTSGGELIGIGSSMRAIGQFRRNIRTATGRADAAEGALNGLTNALDRGIEIGISQSSSTASVQTRLIAKEEVDQLIGYAVRLGNTKFSDHYLFGGTRAGEAPLQEPATPTGTFSALVDAGNNPVDPSGHMRVEIGDGKFVTPNHNAKEVFLDTGALSALRDLSTALGNNDVAGIEAATRALDGADTEVQTLISRQGARGSELITAANDLDTLSISLETHRANLRDIEVEKAMVELVGKQNQYQAAMLATSRVLGLSLANYL